MKIKNWFWGFFFIFAAAFVIVNQLGYLTGVGLPSIILTVLLLPVLIESIAHLKFWGIWFSLAFLLIIYAEPLALTRITPWPVLVAALFLSIAFSILFKQNTWKRYVHSRGHHNNFQETTERLEDNEVNCNVTFGGSSKYLHSTNLKRANLSCSFGALTVFFDNAQLHPDGASIYIDCSFGTIELYVPKTWKVIDKMSVTLGDVEEKNGPRDNSGPVMTLTGNVQFGTVDITYI